jgi:hypothetical protein
MKVVRVVRVAMLVTAADIVRPIPLFCGVTPIARPTRGRSIEAHVE